MHPLDNQWYARLPLMTEAANTEEIELIRETAKRFLSAEVAPHYEQWEEAGIYPRELWNKLGEAGLLCMDIPEKYGGGGAPIDAQIVLTWEVFRLGYASLGGVGVHSDIVAHYILNHGTEAQKQAYLPKMASGEYVGSVLMTEPGAGSDLQGVGTVAERVPGGFKISGAKTFITNGQHSNLGVVVARTDMDVKASGGTSLFFLDLDQQGVTRGRNLKKIGMHSADTSELFFEDVVVDESAVLGPLNGGFIVLMQELPRERLGLAAGAVAACRGALDITIDYVKERKAFGQPVAEFQNTRFRIAEMETLYNLNKAFLDHCYRLFVDKQIDASTASMAKLAATEAQCEIADGCLQLFGGYGYMSEYPISRFYVDARVQRIYGGTSEIMKEIISRSVLG